MEAVRRDPAGRPQLAATAGDPSARAAALGRVAANDRRLAWDACLNVRDLGGLACEGGTVRRGVLVRASAIGALTRSGAAAMRAHGVRTIVDLRWPDEIAAQPSPYAAGVRYRNVPFDEPRTMRLYQHAVDGTMAEQLEVLVRPESGLRSAIAAIAGSDPAIVVHCQAGRDRTGTVVALVLASIGVADEDIVSDYCESDTGLAPEYERFLAEHPEAAADLAEQQARRAWVMSEVLSAVRAGYGDAREYLAFAGVRPNELKLLRTMLTATTIAP